MEHERVVVIGAGPSGLGVARQLAHENGVDALVLDRATAPAAAWRARYDGFRLNTCGWWSHLPGQRIPRRYGRWPSRDHMVEYFDDYVHRQTLRLRLGVEVIRIDRVDDRWVITTDGETYSAAAVLVATGNYRTPMLPPWPGMDGFTGTVLHSADYSNASSFAGRDVVVVGSGNSATDIALQLCDGGARRVRMAVRSPPHLVPRSVAGIPVDAFSPLLARLPRSVLDHTAAAMQRLLFGDLSNLGLPLPHKGIYTALQEDRSIPTLGDDLARRVRDGSIDVVAAVESFDGEHVVLADGSAINPEIVIGATGYGPGLMAVVGHLGILDGDDPVTNGLPAAAEGLWFAGYDEPLIGPLKSFRFLASPLAADIAGYLAACDSP